MIRWDKASEDEVVVIHKIAQRVKEVMPSARLCDLEMDITAAHIFRPLRLEDLLKSKRDDFLYDICGISRHINRKTGKLKDCFSPRYST